jgi:L-2-hydroxycarboxylate dehydrogenase (NAD+)
MTALPGAPAGLDVVLSAAEETDLIESVLAAAGAGRRQASQQARVLVEADLRGQSSHGLQRLPMLVARIRNGVLDPVAEARATWVTDTVLSVDGGRGFGPAVAFDAIDRLVPRADETGVAVAAISNSNHLGMLACYVEELAVRGRVGIALTTSEALVHPWGGTQMMVGTNPLGVGIPTGRPEPFVLDMATGAVSMGKILGHARRGEPIPLGWAVDERGQSTTDAAEAAKGALSPFGGAKGYALGLAFELLVGLLTDSELGRNVKGTLDDAAVCNKGDVLVCISPPRLGLESAVARVGAYLEAVRQSPRQAGVASIDVPGDRARRLRAARLEQGIPIDAGLWDVVQRLPRETGGSF